MTKSVMPGSAWPGRASSKIFWNFGTMTTRRKHRMTMAMQSTTTG